MWLHSGNPVPLSRYCTMNYLMSLDHHACWVVFIAKLSRMPSGSHYIGFQGGECRWRHDPTVQSKETNLTKNHSYLMWGGSTLGPVLVLLVVIVVPYPYPSMSFCFKGIWHSVHIDDLRDMEDMSLNLSEFSATPISKLLHPQASGTNTAAFSTTPISQFTSPSTFWR